jgi:hypothetical protein
VTLALGSLGGAAGDERGDVGLLGDEGEGADDPDELRLDQAAPLPHFPLAPSAPSCGHVPFRSLIPSFPHPMIAPETFNHIENIKKRAGHLWRFL